MKTSVVALASLFSMVLPAVALEYVLENPYLKRSWSVSEGVLKTIGISNKSAHKDSVIRSADEFRLRVSDDFDLEGTDRVLAAGQFRATRVESDQSGGVSSVVFHMEHELMHVDLKVTLNQRDFFMRKTLKVKARKPLVIERVDVDSMELAGAEQPYTLQQITAAKPAGWKPGLGQPLYGRADATFWGVEFPAATNSVVSEKLDCGYLVGRKLAVGETWESHSSVMGVADDPRFVQDAFFDYIDRTRIRPFRLQFQYNTWFDFAGGVDQAKFAASVTSIDEELVRKRGVKPLNAYVIDDGWQNNKISWREGVWPVNGKFDMDFAASRNQAAGVGAGLGLWLSPCCAFGSAGKVPALASEGYESLPPFMSLAGPIYMSALQKRMEELTRMGIAFWKLDGIFGHLNTRVFELRGSRYGLPELPWLGAGDFAPSDPRLNDAKYDELKTYYLASATERLICNFDQLARINPDVYIVISNAAYLSPWWLQHVDASWIVNSADGASGKGRSGVLVYRDSILHDITVKERTQFPMNAMFNHEPKKTDSAESSEEFRNYLFMALSRGTGFMEFYLKPSVLQARDWDVLAEGMIWAEMTGANFKRSRMHGGDPGKREPYGFCGWLADSGYVSIHNPSETPRKYRFTLDRAFGLLPGKRQFQVTSPLPDGMRGMPGTCKFGDCIEIEMQPGEIRILNFSKSPVDFSRIEKLRITR